MAQVLCLEHDSTAPDVMERLDEVIQGLDVGFFYRFDARHFCQRFLFNLDSDFQEERLQIVSSSELLVLTSLEFLMERFSWLLVLKFVKERLRKGLPTVMTLMTEGDTASLPEWIQMERVEIEYPRIKFDPALAAYYNRADLP